MISHPWHQPPWPALRHAGWHRVTRRQGRAPCPAVSSVAPQAKG